MANTYTAVTKHDGGWWIGWIEEVREYIRRRERWVGLFAAGQKIARQKGLKPDDVAAEIEAFRGIKGLRR
jgi:hypothetical protein